eukprot:CAMPEP_0202778362 /NCGR_PEP_ID=MMETSP1388-20130828/54525_1 /ASSEMBLY_ACC=CAM_ASM_000864 /TAXON_ID=37098 /ORGANISM="Isochrysis sp, Strain CCMP1244" /LENGTH=83 /DNA_ID=CAMNT_0049447631 /DNA_START=239 /DNA_END=490 /DNA_ORIENTATION=+
MWLAGFKPLADAAGVLFASAAVVKSVFQTGRSSGRSSPSSAVRTVYGICASARHFSTLNLGLFALKAAPSFTCPSPFSPNSTT